MKKFAWFRGLVLLSAVGAASGPACTVTVTNDDGGGTPFDDGGGQDTGTSPDVGTQPDTGTTPDSGPTPDAGSTADGGSGGCSVGASTGSAACDQCVDTHCCNELVACDSEPMVGGITACESIVSCYNDCLFPPAGSGQEAGTPSSCAICSTDVDGGMSTQGQMDFTKLQTCLSSQCGTACQ